MGAAAATERLFDCADAQVGEAAGVWAPKLNLYDHRGLQLTVSVQGTGAGAQVNIGPAEARDLAKALTKWADSSGAVA